MSQSNTDIILFRRYLSGDLEPELMHQLEKQAMDDPFMWEAMEGYEIVTDPGKDLSLLQSSLHKRVIHLQEQKNTFFISGQRMSIAATASVLFIAAGILFWINVNRSHAVKNGTEKRVEVNLSRQESIYPSVNSNSVIQPVIGWEKYQLYLIENIRKSQIESGLRGNVVLSFRINKKGEAVDIVILKGLTSSSNSEAIRLVKEGPLWKSNAGYEGTVKLEVPF